MHELDFTVMHTGQYQCIIVARRAGVTYDLRTAMTLTPSITLAAMFNDPFGGIMRQFIAPLVVA